MKKKQAVWISGLLIAFLILLNNTTIFNFSGSAVGESFGNLWLAIGVVGQSIITILVLLTVVVLLLNKSK